MAVSVIGNFGGRAIFKKKAENYFQKSGRPKKKAESTEKRKIDIPDALKKPFNLCKLKTSRTGKRLEINCNGQPNFKQSIRIWVANMHVSHKVNFPYSIKLFNNQCLKADLCLP